MIFLKNSGKALGFSVLSLLILTFIVTFLNYIGLFGLSIVKAFSYITPFMSFLIGGILLGKRSSNKGWLEGLKFGIISIALLFIFNFLALNQGYTINNLVLYFIVLIGSILGSMLGINMKKEQD